MHSVLDDRKAHVAREIDGFFISGFATFLFVKELVKPQNNMLLMNIISNQLKVPEDQKMRFNLDEEFLRRPIEIIVGVKECQMVNIDMESLH